MQIRMIQIILAYSAALLAQMSWLNAVSPGGISANYVLCALVLLNARQQRPAVYAGAVFCGLLVDLCLGQYVGIAGLSYLAVCAALRAVSASFDQKNLLTAVSTVLWATFLYEVVSWLLFLLFGGHYHVLFMLSRLPGLLLANGMIVGVLKGILR